MQVWAEHLASPLYSGDHLRACTAFLFLHFQGSVSPAGPSVRLTRTPAKRARSECLPSRSY
jgi:hypothetical protein